MSGIKKVIPRLATFIVGVPLFVGLVYVDFFHHLPIHIILILMSALTSSELCSIFSRGSGCQSKTLVVPLSVLTTLLASLCAIFSLHESLSNYVFMGAIMITMAVEAITQKEFSASNSRLAASAFTILYCGYFPAFIARLTVVPHSRILLAVFLFSVFMCDSAAWLFGNLFGKNNKGLIKASPNKSIAGFLGGFFGAIAAGCIGNAIFPEVFGSFPKVALISVLTALFAIVGDLVESVFKRSAGVKDSGKLIPGRGGMLDCSDSILFAAPIFYLSYTILFQ